MANLFHKTDASSIFSARDILGHTFSTFFKHPFVFIGLIAMAQVPWLIMLTMGVGVAIASTVDIILILAFQSTVTYGVYEVLRGKPARFDEALSRGMARIVPAILVAILVYFAPILAGFLVGFLVGFLASTILLIMGVEEYVVPIIAMLIAIPSILFISMWMLCKWAMAAPVCAVEGLGPVESLKRSSELTKGYRLKIYALYMLYLVISAPVLAVIGMMLAAVLGDDVSYMPDFNSNLLVLITVAISMSFKYAMVAIVYYRLRKIKEGISIESLKLPDVFN